MSDEARTVTSDFYDLEALLDDEDRALVRQLAAGAQAVGARDAVSADELGGELTGDDALLLPPVAGDPGEHVVLSVRSADYVGADDDLERWVAEVDAHAAERGWTVLGVPFNDQPAGPEVDTLLRLARAGRSARWDVRDHDPDPRRVAA